MRRFLLILSSIVVSIYFMNAQDNSYYLTKAFELLSEGNVESAERHYSVYQKMTNQSDANFELILKEYKHSNMAINLPSGETFVMVFVEGGTFMMGCTHDQYGACYDPEKPAHSVTLSDYYIGETEVTQSLWRAVMGTSIYQQRNKAGADFTRGVGDNYPMYFINHSEAEEFCGRLNSLLRGKLAEGYKFRLPTEAQWEYAARGGKKDRPSMYAGSDYIGEVSWHANNSNGTTHAVASKDPNELGIYDMSGNVMEWCADWFNSNYYYRSPSNNPKNLTSGENRVVRGGSWYRNTSFSRVTSRYNFQPYGRSDGLGFRLVLVKD